MLTKRIKWDGLREGKGWAWALALFHFTLVLCGGLEIKLFSTGVGGFIEDLYGEYSGANSGFKFFAPNVGTSPRAYFEILLPQGKTAFHSLEKFSNSEADLRVGSIIHFFADENNGVKLHRSMAASWAGKMLARYPEAREVVVRVQDYHLPTMEDWRRGERPSWEDFYRARFVSSERVVERKEKK